MAKPLILIIEDDTNLAEAMGEVLSDIGCRVIRTECSEEGVRLAEARQPDLVLCDVMLPDGQGFDTVSKLRGNPVTSRAAMVLMTGDQDKSNYEGAGKSMLLMKPFSLAMLTEVVRGTLAAKGITLKREEVAA
jgi:DNA-binding response OmpR family regulator